MSGSWWCDLRCCKWASPLFNVPKSLYSFHSNPPCGLKSLASIFLQNVWEPPLRLAAESHHALYWLISQAMKPAGSCECLDRNTPERTRSTNMGTFTEKYLWPDWCNDYKATEEACRWIVYLQKRGPMSDVSIIYLLIAVFTYFFAHLQHLDWSWNLQGFFFKTEFQPDLISADISSLQTYWC